MAIISFDSRCVHVCKRGIAVHSGISTIGGGYQRAAARKNGRMTERRAKRVTHAQSPYITVGACKLFNSLAYPVLAGEPFLSLSPISFPFHLSRVPVADLRIIEAQLKRRKTTVTGLNASTSSAFSLLPSFNILSALLPSRLPSLSTIPSVILVPFPGRAFIFFQPLPRGASPFPGLC